jgi:hypothetical protein
MQVLYKRKTVLHDDRSASGKTLAEARRGEISPELLGIRKFRNTVAAKQALEDNEVNLTTALARSDVVLSEEDGTLKFRHWLFIVYCLAAFRDKEDIPGLFQKAFPSRKISAYSIVKAERWMRRLDADPELKLKSVDKKWRELWLQFCEQRASYLGTIKDIPLVHTRMRIEETVKLFHEIQPVPDKVLLVPEPVIDPDTNKPMVTKYGKVITTDRPIVVMKKDIGTALQALKQIGVESGTYIEKTETQLSFKDKIIAKRRERGLNENVDEAVVVEESFNDDEMPDVLIALPSPITAPARGDDAC